MSHVTLTHNHIHIHVRNSEYNNINNNKPVPDRARSVKPKREKATCSCMEIFRTCIKAKRVVEEVAYPANDQSSQHGAVNTATRE